MANEDEINNLYKQGGLSAATIFACIKSIDADKAASKVSKLVDSEKASYEALSSGDMKKAYEDLIITGADIIKLITLIPDDETMDMAINMALTAYRDIAKLGGLTEVDMEKIEKEFVYGKNGIMNMYEKYILSQLKD